MSFGHGALENVKAEVAHTEEIEIEEESESEQETENTDVHLHDTHKENEICIKPYKTSHPKTHYNDSKWSNGPM